MSLPGLVGGIVVPCLVGCLCDPFWMEPLIGVHVLALSASFCFSLWSRCIVPCFLLGVTK